MNQITQKWGNSLAVRIPKAFAEQANIQEGTPLEITVEAGRVILQPRPATYTLEKMLAGITDENIHAAVDWESPSVKRLGIMTNRSRTFEFYTGKGRHHLARLRPPNWA